jgi:ankyrin repeat protein
MYSYTLQAFSTGTIAMSIPLDYKTDIDGEFRRLKSIAEIRLSDDIMTFLNDAHSSMESNGASNPRGPYKRSLIHYAAMGNCPELLRHLLRTGAAEDDRDQNKRTPLSWAAEYGALDSVKILLEHGAEINSMDDMYSTPLSWLIHAGPHTDQAKATEVYLRKNGAVES